jgi:hypothetical protein
METTTTKREVIDSTIDKLLAKYDKWNNKPSSERTAQELLTVIQEARTALYALLETAE